MVFSLAAELLKGAWTGRYGGGSPRGDLRCSFASGVDAEEI